MHGLFEGGAGVGAQVQLPNPFNQLFEALKRPVHGLKPVRTPTSGLDPRYTGSEPPSMPPTAKLDAMPPALSWWLEYPN